MSLTQMRVFSLNKIVVSFALFFAVTLPTLVVARDPFAEYRVMIYDRPTIPSVGSVDVFSPGLKPLWKKALERKGDSELQRMVVDTIAIAHRKGMPGLEDLQQELVAILEEPDSDADVVRSVASALIEFDAKDKSELLANVAIKRKATIAQLIEPALARWKSSAMEDHWAARVTERASNRSSLLLAIEGLGAIESKKAIEPLTEIAKDPRANTGLRMAAARALGSINQSGLVELARSMAEERTEPEDLGALLAVELLTRHKDEGASGLLEELVSRPSTAVQANALGRLFQIDTKLVDRHIDHLISNSDVNVRRTCVQAMIAQSNAQRFPLLAKSLDDVNPTLRREVATSLVALAEKEELRDPVIESAIAVLNENSWRGCEQAAVVLTKLDHKPAGRRMVELLRHERPEVKVASAWGLSQLRIKELLPDMLELAQSIQKKDLVDTNNGLSDQLSHLFAAFGDQQYREADSILRTFIPKVFTLGMHSRRAAVWALGLIHEGELDEDLAVKLLERLNDVVSLEPEDDVVRQMCAICLGRMGAKSSLDDLRKYSGTISAGSFGCAWAIEKMTGEKMPPIPPAGQNQIDGWFLSPIPAS